MNSTATDIPVEIVGSLSMPVVRAADIFGRDVELLSGEALPTPEEASWRQARPEEVFGEQCFAAIEAPLPGSRQPRLADSTLFQASVLTLVAAYMLILVRSSNHVRVIIGAIFHSGGADPSVVEESGNAITLRLMNGIMLFSTLLSGVIMVKAADLIIDASAATAIPAALRSTAPLLAAAATAVMALWQLLFHRVVAWVCRDDDVKRLGNIAYIFFAAGALLLFPLSAMMLLGTGDPYSIWVIISALGTAFVCILYLKETFMFFTGKNISILYWFLYLCSVIVLPMSLICLIAADLQ